MCVPWAELHNITWKTQKSLVGKNAEKKHLLSFILGPNDPRRLEMQVPLVLCVQFRSSLASGNSDASFLNLLKKGAPWVAMVSSSVIVISSIVFLFPPRLYSKCNILKARDGQFGSHKTWQSFWDSQEQERLKGRWNGKVWPMDLSMAQERPLLGGGKCYPCHCGLPQVSLNLRIFRYSHTSS